MRVTVCHPFALEQLLKHKVSYRSFVNSRNKMGYEDLLRLWLVLTDGHKEIN